MAQQQPPAALSIERNRIEDLEHIPNIKNDCAACHLFPRGFSHPVDIAPSTPIPSGFPLENGLMTCNTCHEVDPGHGQAGGPAATRSGFSGIQLCAQCHQSEAGAPLSAAHGLSIQLAHIPISRQRRSTETHPGLDAESRSCMECHDGAAGPDAGSHSLAFGTFGANSEHPIGVLLQETERTRGGDFRIATRPDERIRLFGGKVGCGSCHSVYSPEPAQLVMSNRGSRLCLSCHTQ